VKRSLYLNHAGTTGNELTEWSSISRDTKKHPDFKASRKSDGDRLSEDGEGYAISDGQSIPQRVRVHAPNREREKVVMCGQKAETAEHQH
jgi:hypothetical protein